MNTRLNYYDLNPRPWAPKTPEQVHNIKAMLLGVLLVVSLVLLTGAASVRPKPKPKPPVKYKPVVVVMKKLDKAQAAEWVMRNGVSKNKSFAQMVVRTTYEESAKRGVDPVTMLALMSVESRFNPNARSSAGAVGLTQVIPKWHRKKIRRGRLSDPRTSIRVGVEVLQEYKALHRGNMNKALSQYNGSLGDRRRKYVKLVGKARASLVAYAANGSKIIVS